MYEKTIIAFSGRKSAGKNTLSKFTRQWYAENVSWRDVGFYCGVSKSDLITGLIEQETAEFSFADALKEFCINVLGLSYQQCYGTEDDKNSPTEYLWENIDPFLRWKFGSDPVLKTFVGFDSRKIQQYYYEYLNDCEQYLKTGFVSARHILQLFGTDLVRRNFGNVWAAATIRKIRNNQKSLSTIVDARFENEVEKILQQPEGFIIRLTRSPFGCKDIHQSESELDGFDWNRNRCFVLDNAHMTEQEQVDACIPILTGIFGL